MPSRKSHGSQVLKVKASELSKQVRPAPGTLLSMGKAAAYSALAQSTRDQKDTRENHWRHFCDVFGFDHFMDYSWDKREEIILQFAVFVRVGFCGVSKSVLVQVKSETVEGYILSMSEFVRRSKGFDPRCYDVSNKMFVGLKDILAGYKRNDAPVNHGRSIPFGLLEELAKKLPPSDGSSRRRTALLIVIAFTWLMRPSEYCDCGRADEDDFRVRLNGLSLLDKNGKYLLCKGILMKGISTLDLLEAEEGEVTFENQKNRKKFDLIKEFPRNCSACPVKMVALLAIDMMDATMPVDSFICTWEKGKDVHRKDIADSLWTLLENTGLSPADAREHNVHSLRRAGACFWAAMSLPLHLIKRKGRWSSDAIFSYLESFLLVGAAKAAAANTFSQKMPDKDWFVHEEVSARMTEKEDCRLKLMPAYTEDARPLITALVKGLNKTSQKKVPVKIVKVERQPSVVADPQVWEVGEKIRYFSTEASKESSTTTGIVAEVITVEKLHLRVMDESGYISSVHGSLCLKEQLTRRRTKRVIADS